MSLYFSTFGSNNSPVLSRRVICTPSEGARYAAFYPQEVGYLKNLRSHTSTRENLDSYLFLSVLSGKGTVVTGGKTYELVEGESIIINCMDRYSHTGSADHPWELLWVHFNGHSAATCYKYISEHAEMPFTHSNFAVINSKIRELMDIQQDKAEHMDIRSSLLIHEILVESVTGNFKTADTGIALKLDSVMQYLNEHFTEQVSLESLSKQFYISKYYLSRAFHERYNTTIIHYVLSCRITQAKQLLRYSDNSVSEIARRCGFDDDSYFNKTFKNFEGCTASAYKKSWNT